MSAASSPQSYDVPGGTGTKRAFCKRVGAAIVQRTLREKPIGSRVVIERLSDPEMQVFQLLGAALNPREIAE